MGIDAQLIGAAILHLFWQGLIVAGIDHYGAIIILYELIRCPFSLPHFYFLLNLLYTVLLITL